MKYIIEINDEPFKNESLWGDNGLYKAVGFNSLVFDRNGLDKLVPYDESAAEQRGREEAWELALTLDKMDCADWEECFNKTYNGSSLLDMPYSEACEKYEAWKKSKNKIKVGDEVVNLMGEKMTVCVIDEEGCLYGFGVNDGGTTTWSGGSDPKFFHKTGRHFPEVADLLEKMGEPE